VRHRAALLAAALLLVPVAGCTNGPDRPAPDPVAGALAQALATGRFTGVPFTSGTATAHRWWATALDGMGVRPSVKVGTVRADGNTATATLEYSWPLAGDADPWTYRTTAHLVRSADQSWRVRRTPRLLAPDLAAGEALRLQHQQAARGEILGSHGTPIVTDRPVLRFGVDKTKVQGSPVRSARRLAQLLDIDAGTYVDRVRAAGAKAFVEAIVLRRADVTPRLRSATSGIPGAVAIPDRMPLAPTREFARPILGTVGEVTAEIVKDSDGAYRPGDEGGLSGLERRYDAQLRGTPGSTVEAVAGDKVRVLFSQRPKAGTPLRTTLDVHLQAVAEQSLAAVRPASALVALDTATGNVLAAASGPGSDGYSTATVGRYAPGSTFKVVSTLALLRAGLHPDTAVPCTPTVVVNGKRFKNYSDYPPSGIGEIPLRTALANSCNTAFISQRGKVSQSGLADAAAALGLGVDHDTGFPTFFGSVPGQADETEHAASLIGQGKVLASPLAMATVAASVGAGHAVVPRLLAAQPAEPPAPAHPLTAGETRALHGMLRGVVTHGSAAFLVDLPGPPVLAKTGTAEFGTDEPPQTHAWMIAVRGHLAVAVFVDVGQSGSGTAGPVLERFLSRS
jgi:cell division protein FtsI/penicillin-binding protein 2